MNIKVMKFGGTSVQTAESRATAAWRVIAEKEKGCMPVVVVSAIGRKGDPYATDTLMNMIRAIDPTVEPDEREMDLLIACGEILSASIFAHTLKTLGHAAQAFRGGQAGIRTDGQFGNARIVSINPISVVEALEEGFIPVVCGFQGTFVKRPGLPGGELTTLGRGGSDTTAAAIGAALHASAVEIFTDVDGVKTADPDYVKNAKTLRQVTYDEVAEIAHLGAKVVHPRAAEIAMKFSIPLWVKNTFSDDPGTEITGQDSIPGRRVTGVTHTARLVSLQFDLQNCKPEHRVQIESKVYEMMARYELNLFMMNHSAEGFGFAVPRDHYKVVEDLLDALVLSMPGDESVHMFYIGQKLSKAAETQADLLESLKRVTTIPIQLTENCTVVSLVGREYLRQPGVYLDVLTTLREQDIPVLQTSDSDFSLSVLVLEVDSERTVRALHDKFGLGEIA
ncbi:MAG: aspartate kinase [Fimbriimonadaceae bacterium]|nr:aspartate kinase [Fimbriimonadaceae bacterium]